MTFTNKAKPFVLNYIIILELLVVWALIFLVLRYVSVYFGDFGNATLTYQNGYFPEGAIGTNWSFSQLIEWEVYTYKNFGGRVIYSAFLCLLFKVSPLVYQLITSIFITITIYFFYKCVNLFIKTKLSLLAPLIIVMLFFCIPHTYKREGIYWASASVLYIWPLMPLSIFLYLVFSFIKRDNSKVVAIIFTVLSPLMSLLVSISQEQFGVTVAIICVILFIFYFKNYKTSKLFHVLLGTSFLMSIVGALFVLLAPGNMGRTNDGVYDTFYNYTIIEKIVHNIPVILNDLSFHNYIIARIFDLFLVSINIYMFIKEKYVIKKIINIVPIFVILLSIILFSSTNSIPFIFAILVLICQIYSLINYYIYKKEYCLLSLAGGIYVSAYALVFSPVAEYRPLVPSIMMTIMFLTINAIYAVSIVMQKKKQEEKATLKGLFKVIELSFLFGSIVVDVIGTGTMITEHNGYKKNYVIDQINFANLRRASEDQSDIIYCFKEEIMYRNAQPYDSPDYTDRINRWIKYYFGINQSTDIRWIEDYGYFNHTKYTATDDLKTTSRLVGFYDYEADLDGFWVTQLSSLVVKKVEGFVFFYPYYTKNAMNIIVNGYHYKTIPIEDEGLFEVDFEDGVLNDDNNHIIFILDHINPSTGGDVRDLGIVVKRTKKVTD